MPIYSQSLEEKRRVTPEKAVEILKQHATIISLEEAEVILDFMYKLSYLSLEQYVRL